MVDVLWCLVGDVVFLEGDVIFGRGEVVGD